LQLVIPAGGDYVWAMMKTSAAGSSVLTASTSGLASASGTLSEISAPLSVTLTSSASLVTMGTTASLQLLVQLAGSPLKGANVTMQATSGAVSPAQGVTDAAGQFAATFVPEKNGVAVITALVQHPLLGNQSAGTNVLVTLAGSAAPIGSTSAGLGTVGYLLPIAIVVVVVIVMALGIMRIVKRRRGVSDDGEFEDKSAE
ncbi:MAG TPA: Ig-like domain-containing protein, partial [Nitrososphaerales archaeon]|nr:Ig-like domain-containing protein [Nitrososphaerales archaeon]